MSRFWSLTSAVAPSLVVCLLSWAWHLTLWQTAVLIIVAVGLYLLGWMGGRGIIYGLCMLGVASSLVSPAWAQYAGFTLPNSPAATFRDQARIFEQTWQTLASAAKNNGVVSGCGVTAQGSPNMSVHVAAGTISYNGADVSVSAADPTISTAHASLPRIDLVSVNGSGTVVVTAGTAAAAGSVLAPAIPVTGSTPNVPLALVYVPANDTAINANQITSQIVYVLGNSPTFGGTVTAGTIASSGTAYTAATLPTAEFGLIVRCSDCQVCAADPTTNCSNGTGECVAGSPAGTLAIGINNGGTPAWKCF